MSTIPIEEAQARLAEVIHGLTPGEELIITECDQPIARVTAVGRPQERKLGTLRGSVLYIAPDFDAPLEDLREYTR